MFTIQMRDLMEKIYFADEYYSRIEIIKVWENEVQVCKRPQGTYDPSETIISRVSLRNDDNRETFCDECNENSDETLDIEDCFEFFLDDMDARYELEEEIIDSANRDEHWKYTRADFNFVR